MRKSPTTVLMLSLLLALTAGVSPAVAQNPLPAPTLLRPLTNGIPNVPGSDAISTGDGARVAFTHVAGATHYHICFKAPGNICQDQRTPPLQSMFAVTARINPIAPQPLPPVAQGGTIEFFLPIPDGFQGGRIQWEVKSCTGPNPTQCGQASPFQQVIVLLPSATLSPNVPSIIPNNRSVTFQWTNHPLADEGTQLIVLPDGIPTNLISVFTMSNPTVANPPGFSMPLGSGVSNQAVVLDPGLGPMIKWTVASCRNFPNKGRRCSQLLTSWKSMRVPNFFSTIIAPTFRHPRCVNCHAVATDSFMNDPATNGNGGLPSNHPQVNAAMDNSGGCANCHTNNLLPAQGTINPGWHAAPAPMDFRNRTPAQLCSMAQQSATDPITGQPVSGFQHLTQDKLILWAVNPNPQGNVQLPSIPAGQTRPPAPPANIAAWQNEVYVWWFKTQKACD